MNALLKPIVEYALRLLRAMGARPWLAGAIALLGIAVAASPLLFPSACIGTAQPIPFSHRFHVSTKNISCVFCHSGALKTARAGVPPVETCMLCHKRIIVTHPEIVKLKRHYDERQPVPWVRVNRVSEFVFFNHERHVRAGFDCGRCHGDVAKMDRIVPAVNLNDMGFCVQCHRDEEYSHDCLICHR
ncbi:MAG: hypothetical protein QG656_1626 [Candidatus Hydrogenedentes bacterium]|nr:hypothetical protein [Candidatus Hydrogenedentota bacterium]